MNILLLSCATKDQQVHPLRHKQCTNCSEPCKPDARWCSKCRMVLTYDAYSETLEKQQEKESEVKELRTNTSKI
jgi:predicted nucleic acid-binding Zn ribbon protein